METEAEPATIAVHKISNRDLVFCFLLGAGLVMDWDQASSSLYTSGDVRFVRIWDVQTELRVQVSRVVADHELAVSFSAVIILPCVRGSLAYCHC